MSKPALLALAMVTVALAGCADKDESIDLGPAPTPIEDACFIGPTPSQEAVTSPAAETELVPWAGGFARPVFVTHAGGPDVFVVEQAGRVWRVAADGERSLWLDIESIVNDQANEQGLLGMAFHPDDPSVVFLSFTDGGGDSVLARCTAGTSPGQRDLEPLMTIEQPFGNHNGGQLEFGPDGKLYWAIGDGGSAGDPAGNGQNKATPLGAILRLDAPADGPLAVPADNPFVGQAFSDARVWVYGLRNPWRFTFDASTDDLWLGDVGQDAYEEINHVTFAAAPGTNFGWNRFEGNHPWPLTGATTTSFPGYTFPVAEYSHAGTSHCSVTGGVVIRDPMLSELDGHYIYGDFCSGVIWTMDGPNAVPVQFADTDLAIASFGVDAAGRVYVVSLTGDISRLGS